MPPAFEPPPIIEPAALAQHNRPDDCWTAVHGVVYDLTAWIPTHPGGPVVLSACGTDSTVFFETRPMGTGTPHSAMSRAIMARFVVGVLGEGEVAAEKGHPLDGKRWEERGRSRSIATLPSSHITPGRAVDLEVGHSIGADANVWIGLTHGVKGWFDVSFGHATWTGESDLALRGRVGGEKLAAALSVGGGYRFQGVPEGWGPGMFAEAVVATKPVGEWIELSLVPGVAILPTADDPVHVGAGVGLVLRPMNLLSIYGEAREDVFHFGVPDWAAGVRFHSWAHTFTLGVQSTPAIAPLERLAGPEGGFSVGLALSRQFGPRTKLPTGG